MSPEEFRQFLLQKGTKLYRPMPWREESSPYFVFVSELMLQQTQVSRVLQKFPSFIAHFPDFETLASAPLSTVLSEWSGLGYNRRAKFLHQSAQLIVARFGGKLPSTQEELVLLPGIGANTAGAILAYTYNKPTLFIETNIRTVLIYHFYQNRDKVTDKELLLTLGSVLDYEDPRCFYYAMMDYGTYLKTYSQHHKKSASYRPQPKLKGSIRETRGSILKILTKTQKPVSSSFLKEQVGHDTKRLDNALSALEREGIVTINSSGIVISE